MPQVREIFFDDEPFHRPAAAGGGNRARLGKAGVTWSCNAKANVRTTPEDHGDNGLRLLLWARDRSDQILAQHQEGMRTDVARRFTRDCRELGITIHAPSSWAARRDGERSSRRSASPRRSIRTRSRSRWAGRIRAPSVRTPWPMAGLSRPGSFAAGRFVRNAVDPAELSRT